MRFLVPFKIKTNNTKISNVLNWLVCVLNTEESSQSHLTIILNEMD
jgi:hypothetical protein